MTDWCILRTGSQSTLQLAAALNEACFEAWTPAEFQDRRCRRTEKRVTVRGPLLPTFVFSRSAHLPDLIRIARSPGMLYRVWDTEQRRMVTKGLPVFTPFRANGQYPLLEDRALQSLRLAEQREKPRDKVRSFAMGDHVRVMDAAFEGLDGVVTKVKAPYTWVLFKGFSVHVKISTWLLVPNVDDKTWVNVDGRHSEQASSAKAA